MTITPLNKQKLFTAGNDEVDPIKKETHEVKEVMVIEGPACSMPFFTLYAGV